MTLSPIQILLLFALAEIIGLLFTLMMTESVAEHKLLSKIVTVKILVPELLVLMFVTD